MTRLCERRLPILAACLLRLSPVPRESRDDVRADLLELFVERRDERGILHAHSRLYRDMASLWRRPRATVSRSGAGFRLALVRDAGADLRYAARLFARQPAILLLTIVGLSMGLGIATSAFSIMNAAALRGEGLVDPDRVPGVLRTTARSVSTSWQYDEFLHLREGAARLQVEGVITDVAQVRIASSDIEAPSTGLAFVSGGFFAATGGRTIAGRALAPEDERHTGPAPVVVSHTFWTSRLNQDPGVIGRTIRVGRTDATIVGVAAHEFSVPGNRRLWLPLTAYGAVYDPSPVARTPITGVQVFGRLQPGAGLSDAEAQLGGVAATLPRQAGAADSAVGVRLDADAGLGRGSAADTLAITLFVFAVIGLVLLLACANVATVLVSTAITREREMGVRAALGAGRGRIVRQLVTESLALGAIAAGIGLVFAHWAIPIIARMIEAPAGTDMAPDRTVHLFLAAVTLVSGVGAGLAPARHGRGVDLVSPLKGEPRQNRLAPRRLRSLLVITQAAVSVLLIVMAALFARATFSAAAIDVGFEAAGLYTVSPGLGDAFAGDGAATRNFWARAMPELEAIPGIRAVTLVEHPPFGGTSSTSVTREQPARVVQFNGTGAGYFEALGLRTVAGRTYTREEVAARAPVVVISQALADAYWHDRSPVGELLPKEIPFAAARPLVIGVVSDVIVARLHERNALSFYRPLDADSERFAQLMIRVEPGVTGVIDQASLRLRAIDPQAGVRISRVGALLDQEASRPRMLAALSGIVGVIAIVLCVIGLDGLTASVVGQRAREMAVRVAMGAEPRDLLRLLMWDSLRPVVAGLVAGGVAALVASRLVVAAMFFNVSPQDPVAFAAAGAILLTAATLAVIVPTRRASAVDASLVLRRS